MAEPVRIVFGSDNEGIQAQGDANGNLLVREGQYDFDNKVYEDTSFVVGESPVTHDFESDTGRTAIDGYIICDGPGNIQVDISRDGIAYGDKWVMKKGERVNLAHFKIDKIRVTHVADSAYRINLI
tara:strand:- start:48 stop:425 length:378 start_codon:yes stop_codon:yes gene_type:complete